MKYILFIFLDFLVFFCVETKAQVTYIQGDTCMVYETYICESHIEYPKNSFRIDFTENLVLSQNENNYIWVEVSFVKDLWRPIPNTTPLAYQWLRQFKLIKIHYPQELILPDTFSILMTKHVHTTSSLDFLKFEKYMYIGSHGAKSPYRMTGDMVEDSSVLIRIAYKPNQIKKQKVDSSAFLSYEFVGDADAVSRPAARKALAYWSYLPYLKWLFAPKKDGEYHFLLANAFLIKCEFKNNQLHNRFVVYSLDGCLVGEKKYKKGKLANAFLYFYTDMNSFQSGWEEWTAKESPIVDFQARNLLPVLRKSMEKDQPTQLVFMDKIADSLISLDTVKKVFVYKPFQPLIDSLWDWDLDIKLSHFHSYRNEEAENGEDD